MASDGRFRNLDDLQNTFSKNVQGRHEIAVSHDEAVQNFQRENRYRHFVKDGQVIKFPDGGRAAVTSQWNIDNIQTSQTN